MAMKYAGCAAKTKVMWLTWMLVMLCRLLLLLLLLGLRLGLKKIKTKIIIERIVYIFFMLKSKEIFILEIAKHY